MRREIRKIQVQVQCHAGNVGGGPWHARGVGEGLRALGRDVSLLWMGDPGVTSDETFSEIIACRPRPIPGLWRAAPFHVFPSWIRSIRRTARDADAVISLSPLMAYATRWALPRTPVIYAPACVDKVENPHAPRDPLKWFELRAFRSAQRVLLPTDAVRRHVEALYCRLRQPVGLCPLGIDDQHAAGAQPTRAELGVPQNAKLIVTVGRVNENKGQRYVARALARCARDDWWWAIVGDGDDQDTVRRELRGTSMETRVRFVGNVPNPSAWYVACDVFVACSRHETFGLVIGEALWAGRPTIIPRDQLHTAMSPLADAVERFDLGRTFARNDTAALMAALNDVLENDDARRQMGARAAAYARANFHWKRYADCALRLLAGATNVEYSHITPAAGASPRRACCTDGSRPCTCP